MRANITCAAQHLLWRPSRTVCLPRWLWFRCLLQFSLHVHLMKWGHPSKSQLSCRRVGAEPSLRGFDVSEAFSFHRQFPAAERRTAAAAAAALFDSSLSYLFLFTDTS